MSYICNLHVIQIILTDHFLALQGLGTLKRMELNLAIKHILNVVRLG